MTTSSRRRGARLRLPEWLACLGVALATYWPWTPLSSSQLIVVTMCLLPLGVRTLLRWEEFAGSGPGGAASGPPRRGAVSTSGDAEVYSGAFERALLGLAILEDAPGGALVRQSNQALRDMFGTDVTGRRWTALLATADRVATHTALTAMAEGRLGAWSCEVEARRIRASHQDGEQDGEDARWLQVSLVPLPRTDGVPARTSVQVVDVTARRAQEQRLRHLALHDELTGLPNRALLKDRLTTALSAGARDHRSVAVLLCDLDGFHDVNVTAGRAAGDAVLVETARRLEAVVGPHDTVARLGDDEFVVICPVLDDDMTAYLLGQRIRTALSRPYLVTPTDDTTRDDSAQDDSAHDDSAHDDATQAVQSDLELSLGVSIGAAASRPGVSPVQLLAAADAAMHADRRAAQQAAARADERTDLATAG